MPTVTGLTAERMLAIEASSIDAARIDGTGHLIFTQHDGTDIDVGPVPALPDASNLQKGVVLLASSAEVLAGTDASKVLTPATFAAAVNRPITLTPASYTQLSDFTTYPMALSRLYYTAANSGAWDFNGIAGEVITYRDGTDFAKQTWTKHQGGTSSKNALWIRTANTAGGWSSWAKVFDDTGWVNFNITGSGFSMKAQCAYRVLNNVAYFRGYLTAPSGGYSLAATLPAACPKPSVDKTYGSIANSATIASIQVTQTGNLNVWTSGATAAWFSLDAVSYPVA